MKKLLESIVSKLPQIDMSYDPGKGYNAITELMRAIILRVVEDIKSGGLLREEAVAYMDDPDDDYIFSFLSICNYLGFDPAAVRYQILYSKRRISTRRRAA